MLPNFKTKTIAAATAFAIAASAAAPAQAWGQRERDVLTGVLGTLLVTAIIKDGGLTKRRAPAPQPVYAPAPVSIHDTAMANQFNAYTDRTQRRIQSTLSAYGYYDGAIDGSFGRGTYEATLAYARAKGKTGLLSTQAGVATLYESLLY